jgi:hypothetical protein
MKSTFKTQETTAKHLVLLSATETGCGPILRAGACVYRWGTLEFDVRELALQPELDRFNAGTTFHEHRSLALMAICTGKLRELVERIGYRRYSNGYQIHL